jgi:photosystem II stability/assembly factor-like uncharacterized protein
VKALVATEGGVYVVDLEEEQVEPATEEMPARQPTPALGLPRLAAAAQVGSTILAAVDARPPLVVSHDAGRTWRESGRGLPPGRAVAIAEDNPDLMVFAARNRLYVSTDGGRFWHALAAELPEISAVSVVSD